MFEAYNELYPVGENKTMHTKQKGINFYFSEQTNIIKPILTLYQKINNIIFAFKVV